MITLDEPEVQGSSFEFPGGINKYYNPSLTKKAGAQLPKPVRSSRAARS
jgi:hypothetical protein